MKPVPLGQCIVGKNEEIYRKGTGNRVKAYVDLVNEVGGVANTHERTARIDVILPAVQLLIVLERQMEPFILGFEKEAIGFKVDPLYVGDVSKVDCSGRGTGLERMKMRLSCCRADCDVGERYWAIE